MPYSPTQKLGALKEELALSYLKAKGLTLLNKNYHCRLGEIDLIMKDENHIVFVEVRFKSRNPKVSATESIGYNKQQKLMRTSALYLQQKGWTHLFPCRFDVVGIQEQVGKTDHINWIKNAFYSL